MNGFGFGPSDARSSVPANQLTRLAVDETMFKQIKNFVVSGGGKIEGAIRTMIVGDNIFLAGRNQLVCPEVSYSANAFERVQEDAGTVISRAATFIGNRAGNNEVRLFNVSVANQKAANLIINVVDL